VAHKWKESGSVKPRRASAALRLYRDLLPDAVAGLGSRHRSTLLMRANIAHQTGQCGDAVKALRILDRHLSASERGAPESDWVWLAVLTCGNAAGRQACLETIDEKIQEGYQRLAQDLGAATDTWLDAWSTTRCQLVDL
jgi:hypothetical protein